MEFIIVIICFIYICEHNKPVTMDKVYYVSGMMCCIGGILGIVHQIMRSILLQLPYWGYTIRLPGFLLEYIAKYPAIGINPVGILFSLLYIYSIFIGLAYIKKWKKKICLVIISGLIHLMLALTTIILFNVPVSIIIFLSSLICFVLNLK